MGLFDKIKNILFEDDEEEVEIPVYSKEEVNTKENKKEEKKKVVDEKVELEPIQTEETSRFKNIKRDFDFSFDEEEQFDEIVSAPAVENAEVKAEEPVQEEVVEPKRAEKRDVFLSFDEEEFERLNSKINRNEERARRETRKEILKDEEDPMLIARRANSNFSSTTPTVNAKDYSRDTDRYKIHSGRDVKKPFTPSPVISPVYGILDKNYTKDSIVDKKDGMKRERIKPIKTEVVWNLKLKNKKS